MGASRRAWVASIDRSEHVEVQYQIEEGRLVEAPVFMADIPTWDPDGSGEYRVASHLAFYASVVADGTAGRGIWVSRYCPVVGGKRAEGLLEMMLFIELYTLDRAWSGLTDDEFLWEPMPGSWTVQPRDKCQTATPFVVGAWAADFDADLAAAADDGKAIEPLTSIAWLFWHVGSVPARTTELDFLGGAHAAESGWTSPYLTAHPIFTTAGEAVAAMQAGWRALEAALRSATDEQLERPSRFWGYGGPGPMGTGAQVIGVALNEVSHHGTQIGVLRDLYRLRASTSIERYA